MHFWTVDPVRQIHPRTGQSIHGDAEADRTKKSLERIRWGPWTAATYRPGGRSRGIRPLARSWPASSSKVPVIQSRTAIESGSSGSDGGHLAISNTTRYVPLGSGYVSPAPSSQANNRSPLISMNPSGRTSTGRIVRGKNPHSLRASPEHDAKNIVIDRTAKRSQRIPKIMRVAQLGLVAQAWPRT